MNSEKWINIKCGQCGKRIYHVTKRRKFCSQKCANVHRYVPKERIITSKWVKCAYCGKQVWTPLWRLKFRRRFCNRKHQLLFYKTNAFSKNCIVCGRVFFCQPCQVKYRNRKTCSVKCRSQLCVQRAKTRQTTNGFTQHQIDRCIRYSAEADKWRRLIFQRDNYTCQKCGKRGIYLEAHHLKPFAYFPSLRFKLSNGQTLCRSCHDKTKLSAKKMRQLHSKAS